MQFNTRVLRSLALVLVVAAPLPAQVAVSGRVLEDRGRQPVASAIVTVSDTLGVGQQLAVTALDGTFSFEVEPGWYTLLVRRVGFMPIETNGAG